MKRFTILRLINSAVHKEKWFITAVLANQLTILAPRIEAFSRKERELVLEWMKTYAEKEWKIFIEYSSLRKL
jgi:hypothetical protein